MDQGFGGFKRRPACDKIGAGFWRCVESEEGKEDLGKRRFGGGVLVVGVCGGRFRSYGKLVGGSGDSEKLATARRFRMGDEG